MMRSKNFHIYIGLSLVAGITAVACSDDVFINRDIDRLPDNAIGFNVSSGFVVDTDMTRSEINSDTEEEDLEPILFSDGVDSLYIHRYVAPEIERATGCNPYTDTRSTPINNLTNFQSLNGETGFRVKAFYSETGDVFFDTTNAKPLLSNETSEPSGVTTVSDTWYVSPYKYWPGKQALSFDAFAPASAESLLKNLSLGLDIISFDYTVPVSSDHKNDAKEQPDLMFAISSSYSHYQETEHQSDLVPLNFRHALSAIKFAIRDVANWTIVDVSIQGVAGSGNCTFDNTNGFVWSGLGTPENSYTQTFNYKHTDPYNPDVEDPHGVPTIDKAPIINTQEQTFMLIPQEIQEGAKLVINLKYENEDGTEVSKTIEGQLKTDGIQEWEPGKEYIYTISTSSENWQYVFNVIGSRNKEKEYVNDQWIDNIFVDDTTMIEIGAGVTEGSYYKVQSYRYRTNNPNKTEILPWTAEATDGDNTVPSQFTDYLNDIPMTVNRVNWLLENWTYEDDGSVTFKSFENLSFAPQYVATDWEGDWELRAKNEISEKSDPIDLSMVYGKRNTANCYVVNAGGWYAIPLYYGCAIKDGEVDTSTFTEISNSFVYDGSAVWDGELATYYTLEGFVDYNGEQINEEAKIINAQDASLVWADADNIIIDEEVELRIIGGEPYIVFHVHKEDLQQSNAILAVYDKKLDKDSDTPYDMQANIIWSWHIWVTEHWVNNELKLGEGDVECECWDADRENFVIAPYNLGWCDPKNVFYLKRSGKMTFKQYIQINDKKEVLAERTLDVIQRYEKIEYWIGNNTYYQFGRKDPMVGFINAESEVKYNYGKLKYVLNKSSNPIDLKEGILHPNVLYLGERTLFNGSYYNLWNNYRSNDVLADGTITTSDPHIPSNNPNLNPDFAYSSNKTVYDPSPVGYVVPAVNLFKIFTDGIGNPNSSDLVAALNEKYPNPLEYFPGKIVSIRNLHKYYAYSKRKPAENDPLVFFNVTGQRAYTSGDQWGSDVVYLWSNTPGFLARGYAYSFVLGYDSGLFWLNSNFQGTKTMARPVRCVKENNNANGVWSSTNINLD